MFIGNGFTCFQFNNEFAFDEQIGEIVTENSSILIQNLQRKLLFHPQSSLPQAVCQPVFIDFFQMAMPEMAMKRKRYFTNLVAKLENFLFCFHDFFCAFCAFLRQFLFLNPLDDFLRDVVG